jgi:DNA-binding response OmpR family regulator
MSTKTILLVEDDYDLRDIIQDILEDEGYDVVPAHDGRQALEYLRSAEEPKPDAVVLDLMLPHVSGWEVLDATRTETELGTIPMIVISAAERQRPVGVAEFFKKPFNLERLLQSIRERTQGSG